jgi:hypothetical protein
MGFREIPRGDFLAKLATSAKRPERIGRWQVETDLTTVSNWQPAD